MINTRLSAPVLTVAIAAFAAYAGPASAATGGTLQTATQGAGGASSSASCADPVTSSPTGPATVTASSTPYGKVLVVGSGDYVGCTLYLLTSDALHALTGAPFACSDDANALGAPCDTVLWPALLTDGAPIAGPGVNPTLLGTVSRADMSFNGTNIGPVQQVTYAGFPLYRFVFDEEPGETEGANLFDPVTNPTGIWSLVDPSRGQLAVGTAHLQRETAPLGGSGTSQTVLAVSMNDTFSLFPDASFPVYTLSTDSGHQSACQGRCATTWLPVLTDGHPEAGSGVDQHPLGTIVRSNGTHQVTYNDKPLYLFVGDAYIAGLPFGSARIDGDGAVTSAGTFTAVRLP